MRGADRDGQARGDDAIGAQHADREIGDVERAALALAGAAGAPEQLRQHGAGVGPFGDGVAVTAMGGRDQILAHEMNADAGGDGLLTDREVDRALDVALLMRALCRLLEGADPRHRAVVREQPLDVDIRSRSHSDSFPGAPVPSAHGRARRIVRKPLPCLMAREKPSPFPTGPA